MFDVGLNRTNDVRVFLCDVVLFGDAVVIMKDAVAESVVPVGWPPMKELLATAIEHKVPIYV